MIKKLAVVATTILVIGLGSGLAYALQKGTQKLPITQFYSPEVTNAVWDWSNPMNKDTTRVRDIADMLASHQINTVFLDISIYDSLLQNKNEATRTIEIEQLSKSLENYIKIMNARNIAVFAAAGDTTWSKPDKRSVPAGILNYVFTFNQSHTVRFNGMEFDIEAYNQEGFPEASMTEKSLVLMEYLDMVDSLVTTTSNYISTHNEKKFELGFSIPYWFDNENKNIESLLWHDKTGPTLFHLMDRLNTLPQSNVVVMAYRNAALGNDGIIYHSRTEIEYAQSQAKKVRVLIGMETTNVEPAKITFYGKSQTEISSEVELLNQEFKKTDVYGGIAINDLPGYLEIIKK